MRFPRARDTDPDEYRNRLEYLAKDTAHLAVPLLRAACDRAAQSARGLPFASEIIACAAAVVAERQKCTQPMPGNATPGTSHDARKQSYRQINIDCQQRGSPMRMTMDGTMFRIGDIGEKRWTDALGNVLTGGANP